MPRDVFLPMLLKRYSNRTKRSVIKKCMQRLQLAYESPGSVRNESQIRHYLQVLHSISIEYGEVLETKEDRQI